MTINPKVADLVRCLAIYDEIEGDRKGVIDVELRSHTFLGDVYIFLGCSSVDYLDFGNGLWLYAAANSLTKGKSLNVPAMIVADMYGCRQKIYGPVVIAAVRHDVHISLSDAHHDKVQSVGRSMASLGWAGLYNKMVGIFASFGNLDSDLESLDSWMAPRCGIANFSGKDYR